jgi:iron complex outermembrane recepter protein
MTNSMSTRETSRAGMSSRYDRFASIMLSIISVALLSSMLFPREGRAQTAPQSSTESGGLEEIVVTARKRSETAQDTPVSLIVLSPEQLNNYHIESIEGLQSATPQLSVGRTATGSGAQISLRGIGSNFSSVGIEQSVAVILDGAYYGTGRTLNEGLFDVKQIEILKGPQALFFGKNATAGVISVTTADPTEQFEADARIGDEFESKNVTAEGIISGPITNTLSVRVAVHVSDMFGGLLENRGGIDNYHTTDSVTGDVADHLAYPGDPDTPEEKQYLGRVTFKWTPVDNLSATLKLSGDSDKTNNPGWNAAEICAGPYMQNSPQTPCPRAFNVYQTNLPTDIAATGVPGAGDGGLYNLYRSWAVTGNVNYNLPYLDISSVNNFNYNKNSLLADYTYESPSVNPPFGWATEQSRWQGFSTEDRLLTKFDDPVNALFGILYQKTNFRFNQYPIFAGVANSAAPLPYEQYIAVEKDSVTAGQTESAYTQLIWKIVPTLELDGGARYIHETKDSDFVQPYAAPAIDPFVYIPNVPVNADQSFNNWSPEATLTWRPESNITAYAAYKTGYKSGGFSNSSIYGPHTEPGGLAFEPEKSKGFEAGLKTTWLDHQLLLNIIGYDYKFTDLQVDFYNSTQVSYVTTNAGGAKTDGVELETEWAPRIIKGLNLHGALNYNQARYTNFIGPCWDGQTAPEGCTYLGAGGAFSQDLTGKPTANAPLWTGTAGVDYQFSVTDALSAALSTNGRYYSASNASAFNAPLAQEGGYFMLDLSARLMAQDKRWEVALIGKNVTNKFHFNAVYDTGDAVGTGQPQAHGVESDETAFVEAPRTIELQFAWHYH